MAIRRLQCSWQLDTAFPADQVVIAPHFKITTVPPDGVDDQALCEDLATALRAWDTVNGELRVKSYDAEGAPPQFPKAEAVRDPGTVGNATVNREVALCLSFYADLNRPRQRGRIYVPCCVCGIAPGGARPVSANQQKVADLVPILAGLGGLNVDWVVWSRVDQAARTVTNWWVDNSWDAQRRRGLRPTSRLMGTTSG